MASIEWETLPDLCPVCGVSGLAPCERDQETDPEGFTADGFPTDHTGRPVAYANQAGA